MSDGAADSVCRQRSGESGNAHKRNAKTGLGCLTSTRPDAGIFIADDMGRTSTLRVENVSKGDMKETNCTVYYQ